MGLYGWIIVLMNPGEIKHEFQFDRISMLENIIQKFKFSSKRLTRFVHGRGHGLIPVSKELHYAAIVPKYVPYATSENFRRNL